MSTHIEEVRYEIDNNINEWLLLLGYTQEQIAELDYSFIEDEINAQLLTLGLEGLHG